MMSLSWIAILTWSVAGFFVLGAVINTFATKLVGPEYRRWGYPGWFHFVSRSGPASCSPPSPPSPGTANIVVLSHPSSCWSYWSSSAGRYDGRG